MGWRGKLVSSRFAAAATVAILIGGLAAGPSSPAAAQILIVGNDEKQGWDENAKPIFREPGKDTLTVIDISKPDTPQIASSIPLMNSVVGPPTNLAVTPSGDIALVANSLEPVVQGWGHRLEPDNKVFLIDLKANPPAVIGTVTVGKQPSGMAISPKGDLALVANRADGTISVLSIRGKEVLVLDTVTVGAGTDQVSAIAITPDGKQAPAGIFPYNIAVTPDGKLALTTDTGNGGSSDGNVDTVSVIDLEAEPPRVIDHVTVGDSPEGLAISPNGDLAVAVEARGSNMPKTAFFYHAAGVVTALKIDGKKVTNVGDISVGALPEAVAFSPDGQYLYAGNFIDGDLWVLHV